MISNIASENVVHLKLSILRFRIRDRCSQLMAFSPMPINEVGNHFQRLPIIMPTSLGNLLFYSTNQRWRGVAPIHM